MGSLKQQTRHYAHVSLASKLLHKAIERYREKNKGPLLDRAGTLFKQLTLGRYAKLQPDVDKKGNATLFAISADDGATVPVDGLSDGTTDQLYLALRLAGIEAELAAREPMPLLLDDVCIRFDDKRAAATLEVLADLSARTQVIFFTHHSRLVSLAEKSVAASCLVLHQLGVRPA